MSDLGTAALDLRGLSKSYRHRQVLRDLSLRARAGEITALIGPNGAGKSTTLQAVAGLVPLDAGKVLVDGVDALAEPVEAKRRLGYAPQELSLSPFLTGLEFLAFVAQVRGLDAKRAKQQAEALLDRFSLIEARHRLTREYSEGMARKLSIAAALLGRPPVVILDETLNGLDPRASNEARLLLREVAHAGVAVLLTTHILPLVASLADRVVLLHAGAVAMELTSDFVREAERQGRSLEAIYLAATASLPDVEEQ